MSRHPTAFATTLARPWREFANRANGFSVGRGADPAGFEPQRAQSFTEERILSQSSQRAQSGESLGGLVSWRENRLPGSGSPVGRGADLAGTGTFLGGQAARAPADLGPRTSDLGPSRARNATMQGLTPLG